MRLQFVQVSLFVKHPANMPRSRVIQDQTRQPSRWMLDRKQVSDFALGLCNVKQVRTPRLLGALLASPFDQLAKILGKIYMASTSFRSS